MSKRRFAVSIALGAAAVLVLVRVHPHDHLFAPTLGEPAAAQAPGTAVITVKSLPNTGGDDDPWHHYEINVPPSTPPLDMHVAFLVDGQGEETVSEEPHAWPQPLPFKYRLDSDDDSRVKDILEAQGLPIKKDLVTYRFGCGTYGTISYNKTILFRHGLSGPQAATGRNEDAGVAVGEKIILDNRLIASRAFSGDLDKLGDWSLPEFAPKTPPGAVHHLVVYVMFQPHQGPAVTVSQSFTRTIGAERASTPK